MTSQELVDQGVTYAFAHPFMAFAYVVMGYLALRAVFIVIILGPGAIEEIREKRRASRSAARKADQTPTDKATKDGPWTR